ncbi:esterase-like activity of phytase family protein [Kaistia dalseonensis]|uniref:Phytase-like domain-containing protein n=1 Tax=Kaistia dalseonensis TaxID=410840 RepID=A0ABU0HDU3_9HYPH|nr:esterase-like activity of phytase family protein [Kaistia dalseonensis]MCX5497853.1 esterase-like activity of phytase family protein [Kaistia dalseonensis]MDQ0440497.1 hypothetical protein [Kaistia dalseonensis]
MTLRLALLAGLSLAALTTSALADPQAFDAVLTGHAVLPAQTFAVPPADAPASLAVSGRFTAEGANAGRRVDQLNAIFDEKTGLSRPFVGQPVQGFSGIRALGDGTYVVLTDNGFGAKANSADAMLMFHIVRPDWATGRVDVVKTVFLKDPNRAVPFRIVNENTAERYLTGADLDTESIQKVGDHYFIGDEFGPYLIEVAADGTVLALKDTVVGGVTYRSPDNYAVVMPASPDKPLPEFNVRRSKGFEGMALSPDGKTLYPMLEGAPWDAKAGKPVEKSGRAVLPIFTFDVASKAFGDTTIYYPLEDASNSIGDFNMIDDHRALVIERDQNAGGDWAAKPAKLKRVYLIDMKATDADGVVKKIGYIDLMAIKDPNGVSRTGSANGVFTFPFETIENVDRIDETHIIVADDNNFPFSVGRAKGKADNNEFIVLDVAEFLKAE